MENPPLSVTELTAGIKRLLEQNYASIEVIGEVSRLTRHASGHLYFTIKDSHATISAVIWRSAATRLKTLPEEGQEFVFSGHISVYEPRGNYQLIVSKVEVAGAGQLAAEFERRKSLFAKSGWFDAARKKQPPEFPRHIGIVTSPTAAAFEDAKRVLTSRPGWLELTLSPCLVQGVDAPASIANALMRLEKRSPDLILLVRGGGSMEDLWCFNDEAVVRAIVDCSIPIISGIGHEIDVTLADFAADVRAATPSNAAELACPSREALRQRLPRLTSLQSLIGHRLQHAQKQYAARYQQLTYIWRQEQDRRHLHSERAAVQLHDALQSRLKQSQRHLQSLAQRLARLEPHTRLRTRQRLLDEATQRLQSGLSVRLAEARTPIIRLQQRLHDWPESGLGRKHHWWQTRLYSLTALDPTHVLKRGYTLSTSTDGRLLTSATDVRTGSGMQVRFHDGKVDTKVVSTQLNEKKLA
ncbi:MAG: exodeoxyribonuclease VII large subunit [Mariprofundaceae bacterium]